VISRTGKVFIISKTSQLQIEDTPWHERRSVNFEARCDALSLYSENGELCGKDLEFTETHLTDEVNYRTMFHWIHISYHHYHAHTHDISSHQ
jgi:hypothetical protein